MRNIDIYYLKHQKTHTLIGWLYDGLKIIKSDCNILHVIKYSKEDLPLKYK